MLGRLTEKKGMLDLIHAFARVISKVPGVRLTIVGDGEEREKIERLIRYYGLESHVELKGRLLHHQVQQELQRCDLFVMA